MRLTRSYSLFCFVHYSHMSSVRGTVFDMALKRMAGRTDDFLAAHKAARQLLCFVDISFSNLFQRNCSSLFLSSPDKIACLDFFNGNFPIFRPHKRPRYKAFSCSQRTSIQCTICISALAVESITRQFYHKPNKALPSACIGIRADESTGSRIIIAGLEVIEA